MIVVIFEVNVKPEGIKEYLQLRLGFEKHWMI